MDAISDLVMNNRSDRFSISDRSIRGGTLLIDIMLRNGDILVRSAVIEIKMIMINMNSFAQFALSAYFCQSAFKYKKRNRGKEDICVCVCVGVWGVGCWWGCICGCCSILLIEP